MPTIPFLKKQFPGGFDSGDVLSLLPNARRRYQERKIGGSYRQFFLKAIRPHLKPDSTVLELGPGGGSWTRAVLKYVTRGKVHAVDFQDLNEVLRPDLFDGRLVFDQVEDNSFSCIEDDSIDFFFSVGVLCHNNREHIKQILANALPKMKRGGVACQHHGDWEKLDSFGWERGEVPVEFKNTPDDEIWWPRNSTATMMAVAEEAGWEVVTGDLGLFKRDGAILLRRP